MAERKKRRRTKSKSFDAFLKKELLDPDLAAEYLSAAVQDKSLEGFLVALKNVAEAHGGIGVLSQTTKLNRQSMYRMFSERGNPTVSSLFTVLDALGLEVSIAPQERKSA
jgi:probable addiction module antidote protein